MFDISFAKNCNKKESESKCTFLSLFFSLFIIREGNYCILHKYIFYYAISKDNDDKVQKYFKRDFRFLRFD